MINDNWSGLIIDESQNNIDNIKNDEIQSNSLKCYDYINKNYSFENYEKQFSEALLKIINE